VATGSRPSSGTSGSASRGSGEVLHLPVAAPGAREAAARADHVEVEWQLDARSLGPVEAWLRTATLGAGLSVVAEHPRLFVDSYWDTEQWGFLRAGYALRIRRTGDLTEATLKSLAAGPGEERRRREIGECLAQSTAEGLMRTPGPVGERVRLIAGRQPLRSLVEIRTRRRPFALSREGRVLAEIALDAVTIPRPDGGKPARLRRVEIEVRDGAPADLEPLVARVRGACALTPATCSKYELALQACRIAPAALPDLGPTLVDASRSVGEVAFAVLRQHFAILLAREPGTRLGEDIEALHDMRVAARRVRAALALFAEYLPVRARWLRQELGWLNDALAETRDLDVQLERLATWRATVDADERQALATLGILLRHRREGARRPLLRTLDSRRYERLVAGGVAVLRRGPLVRGGAARTSVLAVAPDLIGKRYRKVKRLGDRIEARSAARDYHALRIACRRLRYALEFHADVYGKPLRALVRRLIALQDLLGEHQDATVAVAHLHELCRIDDSTLASRAVFALGRIAQRQTQQAARLRAGFPALYRRIRGKRWRRLRRAMERYR